MITKEMQALLNKRLAIAGDDTLPISDRQAEDQITQTILAIAKILLENSNEEQSNAETKAEKTKNEPDTPESTASKEPQNEHKAQEYTAFEEPEEEPEENPKSNSKLPFNNNHKQWLYDNVENYSTIQDLTKAFNEQFNVHVNRQLISEKCKLYGLKEHNSKKYTPREDNWLRMYANDIPYENLNNLFKMRFNKNVSTSALRAHCRNLGLLDRNYCKMQQSDKERRRKINENNIDSLSENALNSTLDTPGGIIVQNGVNYNIFY